MKKLIAYLLCFVLAFAAIVTPVSAKNEEKESELVDNFKTDIISSETGEVIGTSHYKTKLKLKKNEEGHQMALLTTEVTHKYKDGETKKENFSDEFVVVNDKEMYINGQAINVDESDQITLDELNNQISPMATDSDMNFLSSTTRGGVSYLSYYKQENYPEYGFFGGYTMTSYPRVKSQSSLTGLLLDPGSVEGTRMTKYNWKSGRNENKTRWFMTYADQVESARTEISILVPALMAQLGITVLTVGTIVGAITSGGIAAGLATRIYVQSNAGRKAVENAHEVLYTIPSGAR